MSGAAVVHDDGTLATYRKKCGHCGHLEPGTTRMAFSGGSARGSFMCSRCRQMQDTDIQATS